MPPLLSADEVRSTILQQSAQRIEEMRRPPRITLWDKNWQNPVPLFGVVTASFEERFNETGEGALVVQASNKIYRLVIEDLGEYEDLHITADMSGKRWSGKCSAITDGEKFGEIGKIELKFLHEFEHIKKIICYSNPLLPPELQYPKMYAFLGPSIFGAKTLLFLNFLRRFAPLWALPEDIFNPGSWLANLDPNNWPIVVMPSAGLLFDTSTWSVISTRFGNAFDVLSPTLSDAGLHLTVRRWLPGDPQPAPDHMHLTKPTLLVDVLDKSGYAGITGTALDGLIHYVTSVATDLINQVVEVVGIPDAPEYGEPGYMGTTRPWVAWRNARRTGVSGIGEWQATVHKALAGAIVTGGHSPDWVNTGLKLLANSLLGYIGAIFGNPGLTLGIFDSQLEDVVLAFHRVGNPVRMAEMGVNGPPFGEYWESTGGTGFSLSALQAIRVGFDRTKAFRSYKISVVNGQPFWVGRHFDVGDRVAAEVGRNGRWYVDHVYALKYVITRSQAARWEISIGDDRASDDPSAMLSRHVAQIKSLIQMVGVSS
ncbi:Gp37-like protein [Nocardia sp. NPDC004711]